MHKLFSALAFLAIIAPTAAAPLPDPSGEVVLTVSGQMNNAQKDGSVKFDMEMLEALPQRETKTVTPWFDQERSFKGPLVAELLKAVGATGTTVHVTAVNDYSADIPIDDFMSNPVILATTIDGQHLSVRDKGPLFLIYPFDLEPALYNEMIFGRSVWQVVSLEVR